MFRLTARLFASVAMLTAAAAPAQTLVGLRAGFFSSSSNLVWIDETTGEWSLGTDIPMLFRPGGLAFDPARGIFFASRSILNDDGFDGRIVSIDAGTGATTEIADPPGDSASGLTFDIDTGDLLAIAGTSNEELLRIDPLTGDMTVVGSTGFSTIGGLTIDPLTGTAFGIDNESDQLLSIDTKTGAAAVLTAVSTDLNISALAFDPSSRQLFGVHVSASLTPDLVRIDPSTGDVTFVATSLGLYIAGLTFVSSPHRCNLADFSEPFGTLDLGDVAAFASAFLGGDALADISSDGLLDLADIIDFIDAFLAGCP